jgi:hypothetical protein
VHSWTVVDAGKTLFITDITLFYLTQCEQLTIARRPYWFHFKLYAHCELQILISTEGTGRSKFASNI